MKIGTRIILFVAVFILVFLLLGTGLPTAAWIFIAGSVCGIGFSIPVGIGAIIAIDIWRLGQTRSEGHTP